MEQRLSGKVAIVTGAGQGIGKAVAQRLAREGAGIVAVDLNLETAMATARELQDLGWRALAYPIDVARLSGIQSLVECAVGVFRRIDVLVNAAGIARTQEFLEMTEEDWDRVIDTNLKGTVFCMQAVGRQMIRQIPPEALAEGRVRPAGVAGIPSPGSGQALPARVEGVPPSDRGPEALGTEEQGQDALAPKSYGKIVNFSSISGRRGRSAQVAYAASKAGIISVTQSAALAFSPYNINVNAVCPGVIPTPMWDQIDRDRSRLMGAQPGDAMKAFIDKVPLRRAGRPEDVAAAVAFLCSADADYITGQTLNVDGGFEMN
jgi:meso-butanediol dehydrogenase/(S,S)-butanediol dehydrogenase/diacetyl reductase